MNPDSCRPRVALIGAEHEENLSLRYLASSVEAGGFEPRLLPFQGWSDAAATVEWIAVNRPLVTGLSMPFQAQAPQIMALAHELRQRGYPGHICAGGHFATFEYENILRDAPAIDSVIRHEGELPFLALCEAIRDGRSPAGLPGVIARGENGPVVGERHRPPKLDALPFPDRTGPAHDVLGVPCSPLIGSRGCYADCSFCCIYAYSDNALAPRYRMRSPRQIVEEMAQEYHGRGVRLFIFHDDNFFLPTPHMNLRRYRELAGLLDAAGLSDIALVIKCRPNDVEPELFELLKSMGMIRAYVGIETNSDEGIVSLNRRITSEDNRRALRLLGDLDVYCSFNVLIFDPEATLDGVARNLDFMEEFAHVPFNFCRAEVYAGTPLRHALEAESRLEGSYLAWNYRMREPRVELLFRVATTIFRNRNFKSDGVHNLNMGMRFDNEVMRRFYPAVWDGGWQHGLTAVSRDIGLDSVDRMRRALAFVEGVDPGDRPAVHAFTLDETRAAAAADLGFIGRIKAARREMERRIRAAGGAAPGRARAAARPVWAAETYRLSTSAGTGLSTEVLPEPAELGGAR